MHEKPVVKTVESDPKTAAETVPVTAGTLSRWSGLPRWFRLPMRLKWNQHSYDSLVSAEEQLLSCIKKPLSTKYVPINNAGTGRNLWTAVAYQDNVAQDNIAEQKQHTPLVLVHGLGGGVALWMLNLDILAKNRDVYAMDLLGFGRSSRVPLSCNAHVAEIEWVDSIEAWRDSLGIEKMYLLGHSLGGFLAAAYSLRYPERVKRLILVEPWGVAERPANVEARPLPMWVRAVTTLVRPFNPLAVLRVTGPWGPGLIRRVRPDLGAKFSSPMAAASVVYDYIYQCNARTPATGESAFKTLADNLGWAKNPLIRRIGQIPLSVPISTIYGARSWLDHRTGEQIAQVRAESALERRRHHSSNHSDSGNTTGLPVNAIAASTPTVKETLHNDSVKGRRGSFDETAIPPLDGPTSSTPSPPPPTDGRVDVHVIPQAGHHVYADQAAVFNSLVTRILDQDDN